MSTRSLVLVRHAKAEATAVGDARRELTARGRVDSVRLGGLLAELELQIDLALVSTAIRTRQTWALAATASASQFDSRLYLAEPEEILALINEVDSTVLTLAIVGHNPGISQLAASLDDGSRPALAARLVAGLPTSAVVALTSQRNWVDWVPATARLASFAIARG